MKVGDTVMTIQGPKVIVSMNDEVVRFEDGFAPKDRVWPVEGMYKSNIEPTYDIRWIQMFIERKHNLK